VFTTFATQNPVEFEGTYPLPEAELDRFLVKIRVEYPPAADEELILQRYQEGFDARHLEAIEMVPLPASALDDARRGVAAVRVEPALLTYVAAVTRKTRDWPALTLGASPRATINLMQMAKAHAAADGRDYLLPDDVKAAAPPVLRHRLVLKPEADLEGLTSDQVLTDLLGAVEVPR
jgi:MoxR-like ATPase